MTSNQNNLFYQQLELMIRYLKSTLNNCTKQLFLKTTKNIH